MEQPESNPTFCTNNCGFYGSSQFEGMCSKCYRDNVSQSYNAERADSFPSYYSSSNTPVTSHNLQDELIEDRIPSSIETDNSECQPSPISQPVLSTSNPDTPTMNETNTLGNSPLEASPTSSEKKKRNRCCWQTCNKKLGLTGFDCRCGGQFCSLHRYANEHNCTFDYREHGQSEIRKNMPVVQGERVRKI